MAHRHRDPWIMTPHVPDDRDCFAYCFPHAGAGASIFSPWTRRAPARLEIVGMQLPGRESRASEPPMRSLQAIVDASADAIMRHGAGPIVLFGHSFGGLLAFLVGHTLRRRGREIRGLIVSAATPPHIPRRRPPIHHLPDREFVQILAERYGGIPQAVLDDAELLAMCLPVLRADLEVLETASHGGHRAIDCPIIALSGRQDPLASATIVRHWADLTSVSFDLREFDGGHFFLRTHVEHILELFQLFAQGNTAERLRGTV